MKLGISDNGISRISAQLKLGQQKENEEQEIQNPETETEQPQEEPSPTYDPIYGDKPRSAEEVDRSDSPTVLEYATQNMFKGQSVSTAAKNTVKNLSGFENIMLGPGVSIIDQQRLEFALLDRIADQVITYLGNTKKGYEEYAFLSAKDFYRQNDKTMKKVRDLVVEKLGEDPFSSPA